MGNTLTYNLRLPGQYDQLETGLNYNLNRDYDLLAGSYVESDPIGLLGGTLSTYGYASANPSAYVDPSGLDALVVFGAWIPGGMNVFGHVADAVTGGGIFSYGTGTVAGSNVEAYLQIQGLTRDQTAVLIPATALQHLEMLQFFKKYPDMSGITLLGNCTVRSRGALTAAGFNVGNVTFPADLAFLASLLPGAHQFFIPQGSPLPPALMNVLPSFESH